MYVEEGVKGIRFFGGFGTHARLIVSLGVSLYGLWFWGWAVTGLLGQPEGCDVLYTFMFAKVRADGGIRIFYIIVCVCCIIYFGVMLLVSSIAGWARVNKMIELGKQRRWADTTRLRFATGFKYRE